MTFAEGNTQNFNTKLSSKLAWLQRQATGGTASMNSALKRLQDLTEVVDFIELPIRVQGEVLGLIREAQHITTQCTHLAESLAALNKNKKNM